MYKGFKKLKLMTIALALRPILIILLDLVITFSSGHPDVNILAVLLRHVLALLVLNLPATLLRLLPAPVNSTLQVTVDDEKINKCRNIKHLGLASSQHRSSGTVQHFSRGSCQQLCSGSVQQSSPKKGTDITITVHFQIGITQHSVPDCDFEGLK